jgi:hypothetical protein
MRPRPTLYVGADPLHAEADGAPFDFRHDRTIAETRVKIRIVPKGGKAVPLARAAPVRAFLRPRGDERQRQPPPHDVARIVHV